MCRALGYVLGKKDEHEKAPDLMVSPLYSERLPAIKSHGSGERKQVILAVGAVNRTGKYCHGPVC